MAAGIRCRFPAREPRPPAALLRCLRVTAGCNWSRAQEITLIDVSPIDPEGGAPQDHHAFRRGIDQFNTGCFFEAHETWEEIWLRSAEPEKTFLQGMIQMAAAFHHYSRGNTRGARSLLEAALVRLGRFPQAHRGVQLATLRNEAQEWAAWLAAGRVPGSETPLPHIRLAAEN